VEVGVADHCPRADSEVVETQGDERRDPLLGLGLVFEAVAERVPEERGYVVLAFGEIRLRVDRDEACTVAKDVVVVEVAVYDPVGARGELGEEVAGERDELAAFSFCAVEPVVDLGRDRSEWRSCRSPDAGGDLDRDRCRSGNAEIEARFERVGCGNSVGASAVAVERALLMSR
jgi:hypothetical protein